ncbi:MAG: GHKL domain-containing protein, partial [Oscillospiraceae bacterium]|nr:GHKL domain-containing protein [Oscillospiraceae bacterium]
LLRNAVNYSYPDTEIAFSMTADDSTVTVICKNHGRTIPKEKLDRIFEQFFRVDQARQSKTGGAGLGLAIAKEIVALHGGSITASSENESVEFTVTLPRK